jgi:hypothetical protein
VEPLAALPSIETVIATQKIITKKLNCVLVIETLSAEVFPTIEAEGTLLVPSPSKQPMRQTCRSIDGVKSDKRHIVRFAPKSGQSAIHSITSSARNTSTAGQ